MLLRFVPGAFVLMAAGIPLRIAAQYLDIYLPSLVVAEVTGGQSLRHALTGVGIVLFFSLFCGLLNKAFQTILDARFGIYRCKLMDLVNRKLLGLFYQDFEKKEVRDLRELALRATQQWNGKQPLVDIVRNGFGIVENICGYFFFGTIISFVSPWLLPLLTISPIVNLWAVHAYQNWEHPQYRKMSALTKKLDYVAELPGSFRAAKDIRIYSMADWLRETYRDLSGELYGRKRKMVKYYFLSRMADLCVILIRDGGAYALLISMYLRREITVDQFIFYFAAISSFASWVGGVVDCWNEIHSASQRISDLRDFLDYPEQEGSGEAGAQERSKEAGTKAGAGTTPGADPTHAGAVQALSPGAAPEIVFDHVSFRYEGAGEDTLHELSFTIHRGEKLALVGLNGAGKTTLVKLLCGLYRPSSGRILIDGVPGASFSRTDYYQLFSPVFQDVRTGYFSLAETVSGKRLANTDLERAVSCLERAGLGEKLQSLPEGAASRLNKKVNRNGIELSGGEAQKLMLARALYKDAPVLVLDEPTAALDPIAESRLYQQYNQMTREKTALFISHRLASTAFCDRILLLENGRIKEEGTHEELLRLGGVYKELFEIQSCWYREDMTGAGEKNMMSASGNDRKGADGNDAMSVGGNDVMGAGGNDVMSAGEEDQK